ncbi:MAG: GPW/gp25 family protein, partial [Leptolyngbyaceae cyanobacterium]
MNHTLSGFAFPFQIANGGIRQAGGFEKIKQNVRHLLSTRLGERVMRRTYGGGVHHRLQEANDNTLRALVKHEIEQALQVYMPEVQLTAPIQVTATASQLTLVI